MGGISASILEWKSVHDGAGRLTRLCLPGGKETLLSYELFRGQVKTAKALFNGKEVVYHYDQYGRETAVTDQTCSIRYQWNQFGQIESVHRSIGPELSYSYNPFGR